jgi:hypothetical protein
VKSEEELEKDRKTLFSLPKYILNPPYRAPIIIAIVENIGKLYNFMSDKFSTELSADEIGDFIEDYTQTGAVYMISEVVKQVDGDTTSVAGLTALLDLIESHPYYT